MKYGEAQDETQDEASLPSWERGLKYADMEIKHLSRSVAPLVGAWIEISVTKIKSIPVLVAPLVGAWIEIQ